MDLYKELDFLVACLKNQDSRYGKVQLIGQINEILNKIRKSCKLSTD